MYFSLAVVFLAFFQSWGFGCFRSAWDCWRTMCPCSGPGVPEFSIGLNIAAHTGCFVVSPILAPQKRNCDNSQFPCIARCRAISGEHEPVSDFYSDGGQSIPFASVFECALFGR